MLLFIWAQMHSRHKSLKQIGAAGWIQLSPTAALVRVMTQRNQKTLLLVGRGQPFKAAFTGTRVKRRSNWEEIQRKGRGLLQGRSELTLARRPTHVCSIDAQFSCQQLVPHSKVTHEGPDGMLEGGGLVSLKDEVAEPRPGISIHK